MCGSPRRAKERQNLLQKEEEVGSTDVSINMHGCACMCVDHFQSVYWIHYMIASAYVLGFGPWGKAWGILAPKPEIEPALCIRRRSLNHWITREVPAPWHFTGSILARKESLSSSYWALLPSKGMRVPPRLPDSVQVSFLFIPFYWG